MERRVGKGIGETWVEQTGRQGRDRGGKGRRLVPSQSQLFSRGCAYVFRSHGNCALVVEGERRCSGRLFQMTGAATWKLLVCRVPQGNAEIAGLDIDGRMYEQLTELKWQNFIP